MTDYTVTAMMLHVVGLQLLPYYVNENKTVSRILLLKFKPKLPKHYYG
jgi:hypothetical protein